MSTGNLVGAHQETDWAPWAQPGLRPSRAASVYGVPEHAHFPHRWGPVGRVRRNGVALLLLVLTLGIYALVHTYFTHHEMKRHSWDGIGGGVALVIAFFGGVASPFLLSSEVGTLYERTGRPRPVSASTGLWAVTPWGMLFALLLAVAAGWEPTSAVIPLGTLLLSLVGPLVWFIKTNSALNDYWRTFAAR